MWIIAQGASNEVTPTCREKQLIAAPSYIVKFNNDLGDNLRYCVCTDSSLFPNRNQIFTIVETATPTPKTNEVNLRPSGSWQYFVYEITPAALAAIPDLTTFDYTTLTLVDQGRVTVTETVAAKAEYQNAVIEKPQYAV
jgi:hypothetical protein